MAAVNFAIETDVAARGDELFQAAKIRAELIVADQADLTVFEIAAKTEGELFLQGSSEGDRLDLPTERLLGFLG